MSSLPLRTGDQTPEHRNRAAQESVGQQIPAREWNLSQAHHSRTRARAFPGRQHHTVWRAARAGHRMCRCRRVLQASEGICLRRPRVSRPMAGCGTQLHTTGSVAGDAGVATNGVSVRLILSTECEREHVMSARLFGVPRMGLAAGVSSRWHGLRQLLSTRYQSTS